MKKKQIFRRRLYCSLVAVLSLFAVCGSNLRAANDNEPEDVPVATAEITYNKGIIPTAVTGFPQTQTVATGSDITITDMGVTGVYYVLLGWNTMKVPLITSLDMENVVIRMGQFYAKGDLVTVTEDMTLYAVWAVDQNNDGKTDYGSNLLKPTILSVFGPGGLPPFVDDDDDLSLRRLPDWNAAWDMAVLDDSVFHVGCPYLEDNLINLVSPYTLDTALARPLTEMDFVIEYGGVLEEKSMVGGQAQKPLSRIKITADMVSSMTFYIDSLIDKYPFMFTSIKKDGQGILKMTFSKKTAAGKDTCATIADFALSWTLPPGWTKVFKDPETGDPADTLILKFNIYNKPEFKQEIISQSVDLQGNINLKHVSGTPTKYMMRCINELRWRPTDYPLSGAEKGEIGNNIPICLREMDRMSAYQQLVVKYLESDEFYNPSHHNYNNYLSDLKEQLMTHYCDSIWDAYFVNDLLFPLSSNPLPYFGIEATYNDLMATVPGITPAIAIQTCISIFESAIAVPPTSGPNFSYYLDAAQYSNDMSLVGMPEYGKYLASQVDIPDPCRGMFCLAFEDKVYPIVQREVYIPQVEGVTIGKGYGTHYVESQSNFTFTAKYAGQPMKVTTNRIIEDMEEELLGTLNANGEYEYVIQKVSQNIVLTFGPGFVVNNASVIGGTSVWSHNNTIYIRVAEGDVASIYSIAGQMVKRIELSEGDTPVAVERGVYLVTLKDGSVHKVIVK